MHLRALATTLLDVVLPRGHRLAGRDDVATSELAEERFIDFPAGYGNRAVADRAFAAAGIQRQVAVEITDITAGAGFVRHGLGIALLPRAVMPVVMPAVIPHDEDLVAVPVADADLNWPISLATPAGRGTGAAARAFEEIARSGRCRASSSRSPGSSR